MSNEIETQNAVTLDVKAGNALAEERGYTLPQILALHTKWQQADQDLTFEVFVKRSVTTAGMDNAVVTYWSGMWLAIETDGYTHS